ncbi:hypothetical protein [Caedibacter taeniospiralis]|jgi:hypothetical protein|uniref:hypothetical protein n=1 Tax=Caedibacter taeniospiralis TaxID=28907 RepID=UPI0037BE5077
MLSKRIWLQQILVFFMSVFLSAKVFAYEYSDKEIIFQLGKKCANIESIYSSGELYAEFKPSINLAHDGYKYQGDKLIKGKYYFVHIEVEELIKEGGMDLPILKFKGLQQDEIAGELALMLSSKLKDNMVVFEVYDKPLRLKQKSGAQSFRFAGLDCQIKTNHKDYQIFINCDC